jgi:serine protease Do
MWYDTAIRQGGEGTRAAFRDMKGKVLFVSVLSAVLAGMGGLGAFPVLAQNDPGREYVVLKAQTEETAEDCCGYLGVTLDELTTRIKDKYSYPRKTGVVISRVEPGSPADKAGLEVHDIVYSFNGTELEDVAQLVSLVRKRSAGDKVSIVVFREGTEKKLSAVLEKREPMQVIKDEFGKYSDEIAKAMSDANRSAVQLYRRSSLLRGRLGMVLEDLNDDLAPYFHVKKGDGVLVLDVEAESPALKAGIKSGDVITAVNGAAVAEADDVIDELSGLEAGDSLSVEVVRKGIRKTFEIKVEEASGVHRLFIAPFEQSKVQRKSVDQNMKSSEEAAKLREEMRALKERLKELEDRLDKAERRQ